MSEQKIRALAVSETTFSKMTEEMINHLKKEEHVRLIVVHDSLIHQTKMLMHEKIDGVILSKEESMEYEKELEAENRITEYQRTDYMEKIMEQMNELDKYYPEPLPQQKTKYYVPHIIGQPNSKKKGGR